MEHMHPGLMTKLLDLHPDPKPTRKRSQSPVLAGIRCRGGGGGGGGGGTEVGRDGQDGENSEGSNGVGDGEDSVADGVPLDELPDVTPGLMTKLLQKHPEPALSVRRPAQKCLPSKHTVRLHDSSLKQGLLTSLFAQHKPRPTTGLRAVATPKPSSKTRPRHHESTLPRTSGRGRRHFYDNTNRDRAPMCIPQEPARPLSASPTKQRSGWKSPTRPASASPTRRQRGRRSYQTIARREAKIGRSLGPSPPPTSRVLTPNCSPRQSQFHSTQKKLGGHRMPLKYRKSIAHPSTQ